ncbi:LamG domain-containing protein [Motiliproteus sp. MSK22-1]|uniref:LamG domain-containing protein n=1 Tax=Motiliproteus sp. MSK22-1 TaxID=1897630 RepID=UPI000975792E|nr:LamG domain-containing protein [Motiliproteus sp. MSK22-1]OMH38165.1 hypothetical protein BGP75_07840 [Motiliproteus sp. MSK22-1]
MSDCLWVVKVFLIHRSFLKIAILLVSFFVIGTASASRIINSVTLNGANNVSVSAGDTISASLSVTTSGGANSNAWKSSAWLISTSSGSGFTCVNHGNHNQSGTYSETFDITAPVSAGSYNAYFLVYNDNSCNGSSSNLYFLSNSVVVAGAGATPFAEWRLDEDSWNGTADEVVDSAGVFHGTALATSPTDGQVCNAADLSAPGTSDYLSLNRGALNGVTDFTISVWAKTSNTGSQALFSGSSGSQHNELIMWFPNATTFTPYLKGQGNGSISISSIADNQWHHLVWTRNGTQNCIYIDNNLQGCSTKDDSALSIATGGLLIGQEQDSLGGNFDAGQDWEGLVDEPIIFHSALSASAIGDIYSNQSAGNGWDGTARSCDMLLAEWRMDEASWTGSSDEVTDNSGHGYHGTAVNGADTAGISPVVSGNPGTCRYGSFDDAGGNNADYLVVPGFPDVTQNFSITGWIRSEDISRRGQRVFADDQSNSGGYALSLGDGGSGRLRFYSRAGSPVSLDSNAVITNNSWYFVAGVADITNNTKTIYIYSRAGVLLDTVSSSYSGSWGTDSGPVSIGGETNNGEQANRFFGNLDEVRFYNGLLSPAKLTSILNETHPCPGQPVSHWRLDEISWSGAANEVVDSIGSNHGQAISTSPDAGLLCNAADFSVDSTSDYISLNRDALNGAGDFTISVWAKTNNSNNQALLSGSSGSQHNELIMWFPSNTTFIPYLKGSGSGSITINNIADNQWHHLVWTRSGTQNCLYIDASLQGCSTRSSNTLSIASNGLILGQEQDSLGGSFDINQDWQGTADELLIFAEAISPSFISSIYNNTLAGRNWDGADRNCIAGSCRLGGFQLSPASTALACPSTRAEIGVRALCADMSTTKDDYEGTIQLSSSASSGSEFYATASGGSSISSYTFSSNENGVASVYLYHNNEEGVAVTVTDQDESPVVGETGSLTNFHAFGLIADTISNINACETTQDYNLKAFGQLPGDTDCDVITGFSGAKNVTLWSSYVSPASNSSDTQLLVNGAPVSAKELNAGSQPMEFIDGVAKFTVSYPDAGQVKLLFKHDETPYNSNPLQPMLGETNIFAVIPVLFGISASTASGSLHGSDHNATEKGVSGSPFNLSIQAQCADGTPTPNYQPAKAFMTLTQRWPANGASGALTLKNTPYVPGTVASNISALFSGGAVSDAASRYSEVGVFRLAVEDTGYFGRTIGITSVDIGRFYPDHFSLEAPVLTNRSDLSSCMDTFSYMGETFNVSYFLKAQNSGGGITQNYTGSFARLDGYNSLQMGAVNDVANGGVNLTSRLAGGTTLITWPAVGDASAGIASISVDLQLNRSSSPEEPFESLDIGTAPLDGDLVTLDNFDLDVDVNGVEESATLGRTLVYYGRLMVKNAFGPETEDLPVVARTEYYKNGTFVINDRDNCSPIAVDILDPILGRVVSGATVSVGGGNSAVSYIEPSLLSGNLGLRFGAPGAGHAGNIRFQLSDTASTGISSIPWLLYDWDGDGSYNDDPGSRTATFGRYRGHDKVIFWKEAFSD